MHHTSLMSAQPGTNISVLLLIMELLVLPSELLLAVAEDLGPKDVNSLLRSSRYLSSLLTPLLYKLGLEDKDGMSALSWAAMKGHESLTRFILSKPDAYDIDAQDSTRLGLTALHRAANGGHKAIVRLLLEHGASVDIHDKHQQTPLVWCSYGMTDVVRLLLDYGADVDARNRVRATRLQRAVWSNDLEMVRLLLEKGANILSRGQFGRTVFDDAAVMKNAGMIEAFLEVGRTRDIRCRGALLRWANRVGWGEAARKRYRLDEDIGSTGRT